MNFSHIFSTLCSLFLSLSLPTTLFNCTVWNAKSCCVVGHWYVNERVEECDWKYQCDKSFCYVIAKLTSCVIVAQKWCCNCRASLEKLLCGCIPSISRASVVPEHCGGESRNTVRVEGDSLKNNCSCFAFAVCVV